MNTRIATRVKLINEIMDGLLRGNVYTPESGVATNLRDSLERGSLTTIKRLHTVVLGMPQAKAPEPEVIHCAPSEFAKVSS